MTVIWLKEDSAASVIVLRRAGALTGKQEALPGMPLRPGKPERKAGLFREPLHLVAQGREQGRQSPLRPRPSSVRSALRHRAHSGHQLGQ